MEAPEITIDDLRTFLEQEPNRDRFWLAERLGISKRTVDNWFASGKIPSRAQELVSKYLVKEDGIDEVRMKFEEFELIENARALAGFPPEKRLDFFEEVALWVMKRKGEKLRYSEDEGPTEQGSRAAEQSTDQAES